MRNIRYLWMTIILVGCIAHPTSSPIVSSPTEEAVPFDFEATSAFLESVQDLEYEASSKESWEIYGPDYHASLDQVSFSSLSIAPNGDVWVGGDNEVSSYNGAEWETYTIPNELRSSVGLMLGSIIGVDSDNTLWFGGQNSYAALYRYDETTWYKEFDQVATNAIEIAPDGSIWFSIVPVGESKHVGGYLMPDGGLLKFDGVNWATYTSNDGLISNSVNDIAADRNGKIWFATRIGISSFDGKVWTSYPLDSFCLEELCSYQQKNIRVEIAPDDSIWVAVDKVALFHLLPSGTWERHDNMSIFQDYFPITDMCFSPNGDLWIGKWSNLNVLLARYNGEQWFVPYALRDDGSPSFPYAQINDIKCAGDGSIWLASANSGVIHYIP